MKKFLTLCMCIVAIAVLSVTALAADVDFSISLSDSTLQRGDTITVSASVSSSTPATSYGLALSYDSSVLELVSGSCDVSGTFVSSFYDGWAFLYQNPAAYSGSIGSATFKVKNDATFGTFSIQADASVMDGSNAVSASGDSVSFSVVCNHNYGGWTKVDDAQHGKTCSICNDVQKASHNWDNGVITKKPSCKETGVKTFTCTDCSATKTEDVDKTTDHNYGSWTKVDDAQHSRTCSICDGVQKKNHNWNSGTITKNPSCKEEGEKTLTCTDCTATKTVAVDKTTDHNYGSWTKVSDTQHKHTCSVCNKEETVSHNWNNGTITKKPNCKEIGVKTFTCIDCGATKTEDVDKTTDHNYGSWTKVSDTQHKHTCSVCNKEETGTHNWNNGTITKKPNCKETGVKTFTCTGCGATKTEDIDKNNIHTYSSWERVDDTQHKHVCTVCQKEESDDHSWNSGVMTKYPTCKETGVRTYTCTGCGDTWTETITDLADHTYDHSCDTDCNVCGETRATTHDYKTSWSKDGTNHWHECSVCKEVKDFAAHTPGAAATEKTAQTCTTCGYVIKAALGHKHNFATSWTTDENGHWHACSGCEEKSGYTTHGFENACDPDCSVCAYERSVSHAFAETWSSDEANHWHACTSCGLKQDEAAHEPGAEATATTAQICTICGYEVTPALGEPEDPTTPEDEKKEDVVETPSTDVNTSVSDKEENSTLWIIVAVVGVLALATGAFFVFKKKKN